MKISIAICTWNRCGLLDQTLVQMHRLKIPSGLEWEVLVVNNNCTDDTDAVVARHQSHLPLRLLHEKKQGHSNARNCAVDHAQGEYILWTDDDVLVDPGWITAYCEAFSLYPQAVYFGGTIDPWFAITPPKWVENNLDLLFGAFALRQLGSELRLLNSGEQPFGANMAFRTSVLRSIRFNPQLGRIGHGMVSGDETAVFLELTRQAAVGVWVGAARVRHYIPAERLTTNYIWKYYHGIGRTNQVMEPVGTDCSLLFGGPRWVLRQYLQAKLYSFLYAPISARKWLSHYIEAAHYKGIYDEFCRQRSAAIVSRNAA